MKKQVLTGIALLALTVSQALALEINWKQCRPYLTDFSIKQQDQDQVYSFQLIPGKNKPTQAWYATFPCRIGKTKATGISFEVKGDGSKYFASILLGYQRYLHTAYEATFPLHSTNWQKVTIPFDDFVQNDKPWAVAGKMTEDTIKLKPEKVTHIGFGRGFHFYKFYPKTCSFEIRNIKLSNDVPTKKITTFNKGLSHTLTLIKNKKPLKILLLGDSITDRGRNKNYAFYCGQLLKENYGTDIEIANCGISGHSVRGGTLVLRRSLQLMPNPDLICILYGANDCKAANGKSDFTATIFKKQISLLISRIRTATNGKADILLISGVPRLTKDKSTSTGEVEKIVAGIKEAARENKTAFLNTFDNYLNLPADKRKKYYRDTVHQNTAGFRYIGQLMFNKIQSDMTKK